MLRTLWQTNHIPILTHNHTLLKFVTSHLKQLSSKMNHPLFVWAAFIGIIWIYYGSLEDDHIHVVSSSEPAIQPTSQVTAHITPSGPSSALCTTCLETPSPFTPSWCSSLSKSQILLRLSVSTQHLSGIHCMPRITRGFFSHHYQICYSLNISFWE